MLQAELILNNQQTEQVVKELQHLLLRQPALGLLSRVRSVQTTQPEVLFPKRGSSRENTEFSSKKEPNLSL